jgi:hypothetical protein
MKTMAVEAYQHNQRKLHAGVLLAYFPQIDVHDPERAITLFDGAYVVNASGEAQPLVTWTPRLNVELMRPLIESLRGVKWPPIQLAGLGEDQLHAIRQAFDEAANGWPGVVTMSTKDEERTWRMQIRGEDD